VDDVKIIASQRKIRFTVTDYKNHVFSECKPLSDPERKNLQDELPWQTDLLKNTQSLLESAYDEDDRIGYQSSINLISQSIKGIQHALSTGKLCKISPRKVQRSLQY
jgi:translation elongation factor EF-G